MEKKIITRTVCRIDCDDLDGLTFEQAVVILERDMPKGSKLDYDYDGSYMVKLTTEETDEEFQKRIAEENIKKERLETQEKAKLAELLAKYGDK